MTGARWTAVRVHGATDRPAVIQALFASGAEGVQEPVRKEDEDRRGGFRDPGGTTWWVATREG